MQRKEKSQKIKNEKKIAKTTTKVPVPCPVYFFTMHYSETSF